MYETLKTRQRQSEGVIPHMYLDTRGFVTCGVGHLLETSAHAEALPFCYSEGRPATVAEIRSEYAVVKGLTPGKVPGFYRIFATLRLMPAAIDELHERDIAAKSAELQSRLPAFVNYPAAAQMALLDMAFNLGTGGLFEKFPTLINTVRARDWLACSVHCHRVGIQDSRNVETAELFKQAAEVRA
jgi:GH24 family phage-related lysozyme (muramidase)